MKVGAGVWMGGCGWEVVDGRLWMGGCGWEVVDGIRSKKNGKKNQTIKKLLKKLKRTNT